MQPAERCMHSTVQMLSIQGIYVSTYITAKLKFPCRRFLLLQMIDQQNPSSAGSQPVLSNPPLINKLWVSHILETQSYQLLCQHLVPNGCAIHYSRLTPAVPETADRMQYTLEAYRDAFSSEAPTKWWTEIPATEPPKPVEESAASSLETPGVSQGGKG